MDNVINMGEFIGAATGDKRHMLGKFLYFSLSNLLYPPFRKLNSHPAQRANYTAPPSSNASDTERLSLCNIPDTIPAVPAFPALHFYTQHTACNTGRCSSDKTERGCCSFLPEIPACIRRTPTRTAGSRTCPSDTSGKIPHSGCSSGNILSLPACIPSVDPFFFY